MALAHGGTPVAILFCHWLLQRISVTDASLPVVFVHGGATQFESSQHSLILDAVRHSARIGICTLTRGGSALDAAEAAVWSLEETSFFTAGRGATPNAEGDIELDAMIMDGHRLQSGAVMAVKGVWHPISLARYVLDRTTNSQFVGDGANKLYRRMVRDGYRAEQSAGLSEPPSISRGCDTVGCVVVDSSGVVVSASSTSGWSGKLPGRVGDSPIIGAGVYANEVAGASCTGRGEQILRIVMARMAVYFVEVGLPVDQSVAKIMRTLRDRTNGEAGLIMVDSKGNVSFDHDTPHMPVALARGDSEDVRCSMTRKSF